MPIYQLGSELIFPEASLASDDGLLAVGGDLSPERLVLAYQNGIFPWFEDDEQIMWWSPNPRLILELNEFKVSKSLKRIINSNKFDVKLNTCFTDVVEACSSTSRKGEDGTWITEGMKEAYIKLHKLGIAYSVEVFENKQLVGGLYGLAIGKIFCGESMFHKVSNASKVALYYLVDILKENNFNFIDAQTPTNHLISMGAKEISRETFLSRLKNNTKNL